MTGMTEPQRLQLELMRFAGRGDVADDLRQHPTLWSGALMTRQHGLVHLRDLERGYWNMVNLYVLSTGEDDQKLERLAQRWDADTTDWIDGMESAATLGEYSTQRPVRRILAVWWD